MLGDFFKITKNIIDIATVPVAMVLKPVESVIKELADGLQNNTYDVSLEIKSEGNIIT